MPTENSDVNFLALRTGGAGRSRETAITLANPPSEGLDTARRACRPTWRHAFVRFTENKVVRNSILSDILADSERKEGAVADFQRSVLSETAGAGV